MKTIIAVLTAAALTAGGTAYAADTAVRLDVATMDAITAGSNSGPGGGHDRYGMDDRHDSKGHGKRDDYDRKKHDFKKHHYKKHDYKKGYDYKPSYGYGHGY